MFSVGTSNDSSPTSSPEFKRLMEKIPAGAYTCDPDGLITCYNQQSVAVWGREPKLRDHVDRFCGSFRLYEADGSPMKHEDCWMAKALKSEREFNGCEVIIERQDGERITALAHASPLHDLEGRMIGAINILVDITDRKKMEDRLHRVDQSKNEFLATLAHELRNPLAPIRTAVELLQRNVLSPSQSQGALEIIQRQVDHMSRLVDDLLELARITNDKLALHVERIDLRRVMETAVEISKPGIEAAGHHLSLVLPDHGIWVDGDEVRLAQVFSNLLNNACRYTLNAGKISVTLITEGGQVRINVKDNGMGIPEEILPHIFDMFLQGQKAGTAAKGGLGIGLKLCQRLVHMHQGTISAASGGPGQGSEFTVILPLRDPTPKGAPIPDQAAPAANGRTGRLVAIVDDNEDAASMMAILLELEGNQVRTAGNAADALVMMAEFRPEVVLLDIGLPDKSGYDLADEIRSLPWGKDLILIATTGWGQEQDREKSLQRGIDHHLVKPVDFAALKNVLDQALPDRP